jgi:transcriptional regulator GlxA family with amidase domain
MPSQFAPQISICLLAVPEVAAGVLYGFRDVFSFVGVGWEMLTGWPEGGRRLAVRVVAEDRTPFRNSAGILIAPELAFDEVPRADVVIVSDFAIGWSDETRGRWPAAVAWLRQQHAQGALVCSVCTGSLMLAEAGLLDSEEATCQWADRKSTRLTYSHS